MYAPIYLHITPEGLLPELHGGSQFKAVLVVESEVDPEWRAQASDWLVRNGCRYMMAWGVNCGDWDTSVDQANLAKFDYGEIPDDEFTMTTWHAKESLEDTCWFSQHAAIHPSLQLDHTYIVHIAAAAKEAEMLKIFHGAQQRAT